MNEIPKGVREMNTRMMLAVIDEKTAGKLRWAVMTLQDAKDAGLSVIDLDARLECARALLSRGVHPRTTG